MRMKNNKQWGYLAPELEVVHVEVEQGFSGSYGGVDANPDNPGETPTLPGEDTKW